jgi:hypothetical protein
MTPGLLRDIAFQSVERVSGQKPCRVARSTMSQTEMTATPVAKIENHASAARSGHVAK